MNKTIFKCFFIWHFDQEEQWLNKMAQEGWALNHVSFCKYNFTSSDLGEYAVKLQMLENYPNHEDSLKYIKFMKETGAEYLGSVNRFIYFRKKKSFGEFDIFSDYDSRISHLNRMLKLLIVLILLVLVPGFVNLGHYFTFTPSYFANFVIGVICICFSLWLYYGYTKIYKIKRQLENEHQLFE